jgi:glycosyltransferase involved in cell wall biosynthesis
MGKLDFKVSVVIPLYNKSTSVLGTLETVLNQTLQPLEIVIVNDGSTDNSLEVVLSLNSSLIKIINIENSGVSVARNIGIENSEGDWIAFLDADDLWCNGYLEELADLANLYSECTILATRYLLRDYLGNDRSISIQKIPFISERGVLRNYFEVASISSPPLWTSALAIRKPILLEIGGFPVGIKSGEDLLTWARLAIKNDIAYSNKELSIFVQDPAHTYQTRANRTPESNDLVAQGLIAILLLNDENPFLKSYISFWKKTRASAFLRLGMRREAFNESLLALKYNRRNKMIYVYLFLLFLPNSLVLAIFKHLGRSK